VLLHGGAQNAHTWDTVALALGRPLIAVDLPGHGRSDWRADRDYWPVRNAEAVAAAASTLAGRAAAVVGMSLGGLTATRLAAARPDLVRRLVVVDVTPGVTAEKSAPIAEFVQGPRSSARSMSCWSARSRTTRPVRSAPCGRGAAQRQGVARRPVGLALRPVPRSGDPCVVVGRRAPERVATGGAAGSGTAGAGRNGAQPGLVRQDA
jgi:pimeloyl-ACP methyl ester carboxylesterase